MNRFIIIGVVIFALIIVGVIVEAFAYYGEKKDHGKFEKLSSEKRWKLQPEARRDRLLE